MTEAFELRVHAGQPAPGRPRRRRPPDRRQLQRPQLLPVHRHRRTRARRRRNQDCRGADSALELERQRTKMLAALRAIDADVFGFMEMENTPGVEPLADIVAGLPGYDVRRHRRRSAPTRSGSGSSTGRTASRRSASHAVLDSAGVRQPARRRPRPEPAGRGADVRGERDRLAVHGRREPPEVARAPAAGPATTTRPPARATATSPARWPPRSWRRGWTPTPRGAATPTS